MDQNSIEWLHWRQQGIGASDTPIILGISKYKTAYELWLEKTGQREAKPIGQYAKAKGGEVEAQLRARYSLDVGKFFEPVLAEHDKYPFIRASYDGFRASHPHGEALEIKFVGKDYYEQCNLPIEEHSIKPEHYAQMQHQMLVLGLPYIIYLKSVDGIEYKEQKVLRNDEMISEILKACIEFNSQVTNMIAPEKTEEDEFEAEGEFLELLKQGDRNKIKAAMPHKKMRYGKVRYRKDSKGNLRISEDGE